MKMNALSSTENIAWVSDESLAFSEQLHRLNTTERTTLSAEFTSRFNAHEANIRQKEIRVRSAHSMRVAAQALRLVEPI